MATQSLLLKCSLINPNWNDNGCSHVKSIVGNISFGAYRLPFNIKAVTSMAAALEGTAGACSALEQRGAPGHGIVERLIVDTWPMGHTCGTSSLCKQLPSAV